MAWLSAPFARLVLTGMLLRHHLQFAYVSTILIAKNKAAQLDRVMEERERVLEAAQNGAVDADLELYSLVRRCSVVLWPAKHLRQRSCTGCLSCAS